ASRDPVVRSGGFEFVFLDALHTYDGLREDWEAWSPLVANGGVIAIHDSRASPGGHSEDVGGVRFTNDGIVKDDRFEMVETIGLIGFGRWGPNYARVLCDLPGAELAIICDRSADRLDLVRQRYPTVTTCRDLDPVLRRDRLDAVVIATSASTHEDIVKRSLDAGLHVLVEKPMALRADSCTALTGLAAAADRVLMIGYTFLYNAGVRKMKECMAADQFGDVYYLHATRTNLGPIRPDVNAVLHLAPHDVAIFKYLPSQP